MDICTLGALVGFGVGGGQGLGGQHVQILEELLLLFLLLPLLALVLVLLHFLLLQVPLQRLLLELQEGLVVVVAVAVVVDVVVETLGVELAAGVMPVGGLYFERVLEEWG